MDLERYLNTTTNPNAYGSLYLSFVNLKALSKYDTHIIDKEYMDKDLAPLEEHRKIYYKGVLIC